MTTVEKSTLYLVPTPIGNLEDITIRALEVLKQVDIIACEDTRHSLKLLNHFEIKKRLIAYHSYNEKNSSQGIVKLLQQGNSVAIISDGGSPCISDPGYTIVQQCIAADIRIIPLPGPTAFVPLLSASGFRTDLFVFSGFLSCKSGKRRTELSKLSSFIGTIILYESPHRIIKMMQDIAEIFPEKVVCIGKEISKINEKIYRGKPSFLNELLTTEKIAGEYVVAIANYDK